MHVLSIAPAFSTTGVSVHVEQINSHLARQGHQLTIAPLKVDDPAIVMGSTRHPLAFPTRGGDWFEEKLALADLYTEALQQRGREQPFDLIHSHDWLAAHIGRQLARDLGTPHLSTVHTLAEIQRQRVGLPGRLPPHLGQINLEKQLCQGNAELLTVGESIRRLMTDVGSVNASSVPIIRNGVDPTIFAQPRDQDVTRLRRRLAPNGERLVLFVGRLAPQKGVDFLLRSSYLVRKSRPATRWVIVGDHVASYMMRPVYDQVIADGGSSSHLSFEGQVPWEKILPYYHAADCVVLPSLFESCPYVALEAMASGTPVIASDLDSLREIIDHGENGILVPVDDDTPIAGPNVEALAQAQLEILENPSLRSEFVEAGRRRIERRHSLDRQVALVTDLYASITDRSALRSSSPEAARRTG